MSSERKRALGKTKNLKKRKDSKRVPLRSSLTPRCPDRARLSSQHLSNELCSAATLFIKIQGKNKHFRTWLVTGDVREELRKSCHQRHRTTLPDGRGYQDHDLGSPTHGKHFNPRKVVEIIIFHDSLIVKSIGSFWHNFGSFSLFFFLSEAWMMSWRPNTMVINDMVVAGPLATATILLSWSCMQPATWKVALNES